MGEYPKCRILKSEQITPYVLVRKAVLAKIVEQKGEKEGKTYAKIRLQVFSIKKKNLIFVSKLQLKYKKIQ